MTLDSRGQLQIKYVLNKISSSNFRSRHWCTQWPEDEAKTIYSKVSLYSLW